MMTPDQLRAALYGRNLSQVARDSGISYDALYRFVGKPLPMFEHMALSDYLDGLTSGAHDAIEGGTWAQVAAAIDGASQ